MVPEDQPSSVMCWAMGLQICEILVLSLQPDATVSVAIMHGSGVGWSASFFVCFVYFCSPGNCDLSQTFARFPLCPDSRTSHRAHPLLRKKKSDSVVEVLRFAHNVLRSLVPRAKEGDLWEVKIWSGSGALFLCMEYRPLDNCSHKVLCP